MAYTYARCVFLRRAATAFGHVGGGILSLVDATDTAGSLFGGLLCGLGLTAIGVPVVPAVLASLLTAATLIGRCRRRRRES